jgi:hypothetical protein
MSIIVKDANSVDRYYEAIESGTSGNPFQSVVPDFKLAHAIRVVEADDSVDVSIWEKAKGLRKFGRNSTVGTSFETVGELQGTESNETFVTTNLIDGVSSSSASDTSQTIVIEGHTVDGSGNLTFVSQEAILLGQTEVTLTTPLARATRAYVKPSGTFGTTPTALVGNVYIYDNTGGVGSGTPTVASGTKLMISAGNTQTQKCATSTSSADYWFIDSFSAAVGVAGGSASRVEIRIELRDIANGGAWRPAGRNIELTVGQNGITYLLDPCIIVPPNHDIRVRAKTDSNTAEVVAELAGYLAIIT